MKLLSTIDRVLAPGRGAGAGTPRLAADGHPRRQGEDVAAAIGERYERMNLSLDQLAGLVDQLRAFEPSLKEMRDPLQAEYAARRADYIELVNLRTAYSETSAALEAATAEARTLAASRDALEQRLEAVRQQLAEQTATVEDAHGRIETLRADLAASEAGSKARQEAERIGQAKVRQLEQDLEAAGRLLGEADAGRVEASEGRGQAERSHALATEENEALKRRLDELQAEVARLARAEATLDGQLTAERARAQSDQAEAARAIQSFEGQVETARAEFSALQVRLETTTARADRLDKLNGDLTTRLAETQAARQAGERSAGRLQVDLLRAEEKLKESRELLEDVQQRQSATDTARQAAVERADQLSKSAAAAERGLARSEERAARLQDAIDGLRADGDAKTRALVEQMEVLKARMQEAQAESAMTAAALETARRSRIVSDLSDAANA